MEDLLRICINKYIGNNLETKININILFASKCLNNDIYNHLMYLMIIII